MRHSGTFSTQGPGGNNMLIYDDVGREWAPQVAACLLLSYEASLLVVITTDEYS